MHYLTAVGSAVAAILLYVVAIRRRPIKYPVDESTIVLITGASSGIGEEIAIQLARKKCKLILVARNLERLEATMKKCQCAGSPLVLFESVDVTKEENLSKLRKKLEVCGLFHSVSLLVLNAGRGAVTPFDSTPKTASICEDMMKLNYHANVRLTQDYLQPLKKNKGAILVVSSLAGVFPTPYRAAYCASKHAVQGFYNALRLELLRDNVRVCVVCPGFVMTAFHENVMTVRERAPEREKKNFMTAAQCAALSISAVETGQRELIMTSEGKLGYALRPLLTSVIDYFAMKKAMHTMKDAEL